MHLARFVRIRVSFVILGLAGSVIGCSGGPSATPPDQEAEKKISADMKAAHKEAQAAKKDIMGGMMKGGGPR
jgi:hypothetical protein